MPSSFVYPVTPANVPVSVTEPSPAFKKQIGKVLGSIFLFFAVYLLLFFLAVCLTIGCIYAGYYLITSYPRIITIFIGVGLMGLGVMVFFFLIKFIFAVSKFDRSGY